MKRTVSYKASNKLKYSIVVSYLRLLNRSPKEMHSTDLKETCLYLESGRENDMEPNLTVSLFMI